MKEHLSEREFQRQMNKIKKENEHKQKLLLLQKEKDKFKKINPIETSKLIAIYLFWLLNLIIVYSMVAMWKFEDFSYLGVLISDIAAQVMIYAIYCMKAYHGKKQNELMNFYREKLKGNLGDILDAGGECSDSIPLTKGNADSPNFGEEAVG